MSKIIGYTTGVFDLFHIGHLNIIKRAKLECDHLIVGVTTDELAESRKHKKPIIPLNERMAIVEALRYVDEVVPQISMDKMEAFRNYRFDRVFVGSDWEGTDAWNMHEANFREVGVEVRYIKYTEHTSSSYLRSVLDKIE